MTKRKKRKKGYTPPIDFSHGPMAAAKLLSRQEHLKRYPNCAYEGPHYVPPPFGQIGFYMCNPPADLANHTRCFPPYDHDHPDHIPEEFFPRHDH
jgi:hypothetical protein